ncbi:hypothetical protein DXZ20_27140 [Leptolyngbyaceae cyanobacterium CCMR0081]|uniref:Uncharacterized protein n=1 Tax=Adonisia turfae CCMR0081 TaxID=2292702 RepID=A0A6M0RSM4_9CYAN|nr:hypothetical protein [Adonisia turfae CCMR0081]
MILIVTDILNRSLSYIPLLSVHWNLELLDGSAVVDASYLDLSLIQSRLLNTVKFFKEVDDLAGGKPRWQE